MHIYAALKGHTGKHILRLLPANGMLSALSAPSNLPVLLNFSLQCIWGISHLSHLVNTETSHYLFLERTQRNKKKCYLTQSCFFKPFLRRSAPPSPNLQGRAKSGWCCLTLTRDTCHSGRAVAEERLKKKGSRPETNWIIFLYPALTVLGSFHPASLYSALGSSPLYSRSLLSSVQLFQVSANTSKIFSLTSWSIHFVL